MKSFIKKFFDKSMLLFLIIGACNTVLSLALQFALFNWAHFGYWGSSATAFAICSISSFYFNKKYSFKNTEKVWITALRFALVIAVCYVLAYYVAQPPQLALASPHTLWAGLTESKITDQIAMLVGQVIFTLLNYTVQKFFAFKNQEDKKEG